jgi:hypothetical protein
MTYADDWGNAVQISQESACQERGMPSLAYCIKQLEGQSDRSGVSEREE